MTRWDHRGGDGNGAGGLNATRRAVVGGGLGLGLAPRAALAAVSPRVVADVPIRLDGGAPWTGVWIEKQGPFRFGISTGTNLFTLWAPLAEKLSLQKRFDAQVTRGYLERDAPVYRAKEIVVGGAFGLTAVDFVGSRGEREPVTVGLLPLLPDRVTAFDLDAGFMRYLPDKPPDPVGYTRVALIAAKETFLTWQPEVLARLGGRTVRLRISTGSSGGVTLTPDAVRRLGIWDGQEPHYERVRPVGAGQLRMRTTRRGDLELGDMRFPRPLLELHDPGYAAPADRNDDGSIGMALLRRCNFVFDQPRRIAWLKPRAGFDEAWSHDRAGFDLDTGKDGRWVASVVDPGSPAERAGLKVGDMLAATQPDAGSRVLGGRFTPGPAKLSFGVLRAGVRHQIDIVLEDRV